MVLFRRGVLGLELKGDVVLFGLWGLGLRVWGLGLWALLLFLWLIKFPFLGPESLSLTIQSQV